MLSEFAREITGIEMAASAVADAKRNCQNNNISNCRFIMGEIRNCLPKLRHRPDLLVIDPPRAGMHKMVVKQVLDMAPEQIIYVSCNPATMARDIRMMGEHYQISEVQPVDMFPHTYHVETVVKLAKQGT
jgi:23S rRNA (uracil1939-C5)-methyltransferase